MVVAIHQPTYLPYLGIFYKLSKADVFIIFDDAQFTRGYVHECNTIKTSNGSYRLKVPVEYNFGDALNQVRTKDELGWKEKHLKALAMNYSRAPYFKEVFPVIEELLSREYASLAEMNAEILKDFSRRMGFAPKFCYASQLGVTGSKEEKVINLCEAVRGDVYISGLGAKDYQKPEHFAERGIELKYSDYAPIVYEQQWQRNGFLPNASVVDYLFNCGFSNPFADGSGSD